MIQKQMSEWVMVYVTIRAKLIKERNSLFLKLSRFHNFFINPTKKRSVKSYLALT